MSGHYGIIRYLLQLDRAERISHDVPLPLGRHGQVRGVKDLAYYLGLKGHATISGAGAKITTERQRRFAELYRFEEDTACMQALKIEHEDNFRSAFAALRDKRNKPELTSPAPVPRTIDRLLAEDKDNQDQSKANQFASLSLWIDKLSDEPGTAFIRPDLNCHTVKLNDGIHVTIKEATLEFHLGSAETVRPAHRYGAKAPLEASNASFALRDISQNRPSWTVKATDGTSIGSVLELPDDFLKVMRLAPGEIIRGYLGGEAREININVMFAFPTDRPATSLEKKVAALLKQLELWSDSPAGRRQQLATAMVAVKERT